LFLPFSLPIPFVSEVIPSLAHVLPVNMDKPPFFLPSVLVPSPVKSNFHNGVVFCNSSDLSLFSDATAGKSVAPSESPLFIEFFYVERLWWFDLYSPFRFLPFPTTVYHDGRTLPSFVVERASLLCAASLVTPSLSSLPFREIACHDLRSPPAKNSLFSWIIPVCACFPFGPGMFAASFFSLEKETRPYQQIST